jgi:hypothetical protein
LPTKLIKSVILTLTNTTAKVRINNKLSEEFEVRYEVKQGDPFSASLFILVTDHILKQLDIRGNISTRLEQCTAHADDILITARTEQTIIDTFNKLKDQSQQFGLVINEQKTKLLFCTRKSYKPDSMKTDDLQLEQVMSYKYLGSTVNSNNSIEEEIKERIVLGNKAYYANQSLFKSKLISKKAKLKLYNTTIRPVVTIYACETLVLKVSQTQVDNI